MLGYAASVSRNHKTAATTQTYVSYVTRWWHDTYRATLWDPKHNGGLKVFFAGLEKMKQENATDPREGYSMDDIITLNRWATISNTKLEGRGRKMTERELVNVRAVRQMAWQLLYRLGELLPPDTARDPWDPRKRLTRGNIRFVRDESGEITSVSCPTP